MVSKYSQDDLDRSQGRHRGRVASHLVFLYTRVSRTAKQARKKKDKGRWRAHLATSAAGRQGVGNAMGCLGLDIVPLVGIRILIRAWSVEKILEGSGLDGA